MSSAARAAVETTQGAPDESRRRRRRRRANSRGVSTLMYAAQQGDVDRVREIIRDKPSSLFDQDRTGKSALHYSCTGDNARAAHAADLLVMAAPDLVEEHDEDGFTPLHLAVIAGNMQLVTFLLANGADVRAVDNEQHTVVHWATVCGETAALRAVMAAGAPVSTPDVHGGYPLHYAAQMCGGVSNDRDSSLGMQVLQALLSHSNIVVSVTDGDKRQPLLWAASAGSAKAVLALVRAGAAVEAADKDGLTALHCAASRGHTDCLDTLLTLCGASPDVIDSNGCTALHYAVTLGHADATALLLAHGADPNRQDRKGRSPAHCGCAKGQFETVKLIGSHGANLWLRNARGDLPLHEAAASGRRDLVKWLLEMRPSQVNARNNDGKCPLHMAALNDNSDMCKILLDAGAHVNPILRTSKNVFMTPLDCALQRGFRSTAKYLQLHGGVPANRLASAQRNQQPNSALNFQIRDDVTFWGDTSSDTDRENKSGKRTVRKKISHKREKKKESVSDSDVEAPPLQNNKSDSAGSRTKRKTKEESGEKNISAKINNQQSAAPSSIRNSSRKLPTSRIDYTNEIIINGKTEINIHHTNEIIIDREPATMDQVNETIIPSEVPDTNRRIASAKGRRPRSAKYSKGKSARSSAENRNIPAVTAAEITSPETAIQQEAKETEMRKEHSLKDQSTNTSEETMVTVIENKNAKAISEDDSLRIDDTAVVGSKNLPDQQSLMSNTSEDVESHKDLIVEASIHAPPKSAEAKLEKSDEPKVTETDAKECEAATVEPTLETEAEVTSSGKEAEPPTQNQENNKLLQEDELNEGILLKEIDSNKTDVAANGASVTTDDHKNISEQELDDKLDESERKGSRDVSTGVNDAIKDPSVVIEDPSGVVKDTSDDTEVKPESIDHEKSLDKNGDVVETTQSVKSEHEVQEESPKVENEEMTNKTRADESVGKDNEESEEKKENIEVNEAQGDQDNFNLQENKALLTTGTASEEKETENIGTPPESPTKKSGEKGETVDDEAESIQKEKEALSKEENVESSAAKIEATVDKIKGGQSNATAETRHEKSSDGKIPKKAAVEPEKIRNKKSVVVTNKTKVKGAEEIRKKKQIKDDRQKEEDEHEEYSEDFSSEDSSVSTTTKKTHKSFRVLDEREAAEIDKSGKNKPKRSRTKNSARKGSRSRSTENKAKKEDVKERGFRRSKIPTPLVKTVLSKSDKHLDKAHKTERKSQSTLDTRVPSLPNIHQGRCALKEPPRPESNMSAPLLTSVYSDNERDSMSDVEDGPRRSKKRVKKRPRTREARSAGSDYESSNLIDSGFEPSPRSTRIPRWKNMSERAVNMTSVTQSIQNNIRRYHLERKIFQHLLELKRLQIRAGQHNEAVLVKRAIDAYHQSCASTVGAGKYIPEDFSFKSFERFLYESLRKLQKTDVEYMKGLPEASTNPLLCTRSTNRCMHATHAYTGIPCAAYLPKMDHHTIPKIGFNDVSCKPGTGFLPNINSKKAVTLELSHGSDKQVISLPADRLDQNKRYYVTFTVKGNESSPSNGEDGPNGRTAHRHSKSD